jgi:hypothetical protein
MTRRADNQIGPADLPELVRGMRKIAALALTASDRAEIEPILAGFFSALIELDQYRAGAKDRRRRKSLAKAAAIDRDLAASATLEQIRDRTGLSPSQIRRLRALNRARMTSRVLFVVNEGARRFP